MIQWCIVQSTEYCKHRKKYERDKLLCKKLEEALECLSNAEKPERLGDEKYGRYKGAYGYRLTKSVRLIYQVNYGTREIALIALGNHKEVYGHD